MKVMFKFAAKRGLIRLNPFKEVEKLHARPKQQRIVSLEEEQK